MASKGQTKASLFTLSRERWAQVDHVKLAEELSQGSDRASAIVGSTIIDVALMDALNTYFQKMSDEDQEALFYSATAPLQTFSAKIRVGHAIGMYGVKLRRHPEAIRRIRNVFAHSPRPLQFDHSLILREMDALRDVSLADVGLQQLTPLVSVLRAKFIANCADLAMTFDKYARLRARRRILIVVPDWPDDEPPPLLHKSIQQHRWACHTLH